MFVIDDISSFESFSCVWYRELVQLSVPYPLTYFVRSFKLLDVMETMQRIEVA